MPPVADEAVVWTAIRSAAATPNPIAALESTLSMVIDDSDPDFPNWRSRREVSPQAARLLDLYLPIILHDTSVGPYAIAHLGQSLDGRIATVIGASHYVTGPQNIDHLHRLRALCDAVVVGAGTVEADNPRLTVRRVDGENPARVVIDPRGRLSPMQAMFSDGAARTLIYRTASAPAAASFGDDAVEIRVSEGTGDQIDPVWVLNDLAARGLNRILVEGGGVTVSRFLQRGCLDRLQITVSPIIIGSGRPGVTLPEIDRLDRAMRPRSRTFQMGGDVLFDCVPGKSAFP